LVFTPGSETASLTSSTAALKESEENVDKNLRGGKDRSSSNLSRETVDDETHVNGDKDVHNSARQQDDKAHDNQELEVPVLLRPQERREVFQFGPKVFEGIVLSGRGTLRQGLEREEKMSDGGAK